MKKLQVWLPLLFALVLIAGMWIGSGLRKNLPASRGIFELNKRSSLEEVMDLVNMKYVDKINTDTLTDEAIQSMLNHLDPHSVYIPASHLTSINEELQGNFEGIGIEFFIIDDTVNITNVLDGGPSDKAGLKTGDKFLKVENEIVAGDNITSDRIKQLLRGVSGSKVAVTVQRDKQPVTTTITRGTIPLYSVDAAYMMDNNTGYIHLNKFSGTTYEEFMQAMEKLKEQGMTQLIFDLRDNGGGILGEAVDIADEFLDGDKLIVYTQGEKQDKLEYFCKRPGLFEEGELVLLVNENSASASEVVAGALQDWDRATIVGRRTFGKGLVQEQYDLSDGAALRLTVARYYTPLKRNIQKPYINGREAYQEELFHRYQNGELVNGDTISQHTGPKYETPKGRIVYGGGGITPDVFVPLDTSTFSSNLYVLFDNSLYNRFIYSYSRRLAGYFNQFKNPKDFGRRFNETEKAWNSLLDFAARDSVYLTTISPKDKAEMEKRIKISLARQIWRTEGYYELMNLSDPLVLKAKEILEKK